MTKPTAMEETMRYSQEQLDEMDILIRYNLSSNHQGIKVHSKANSDQINAAQRLFDKGLVTQVDGGYLTDLGRTAAEHAQALLLILTPHKQSMAS